MTASDGKGVDPHPTTRIAITVCTHRRPEGLRSLLDSLALLDRPENSSLRVVVVDNDPSGSARAVLPTDFPWPITYEIERTPGIPAARTRCVSIAGSEDFVMFVDDDEVVDPRWVVDMLALLREERADGVGGLVAYEYERQPAAWVVAGGFFDAPSTTHGASIPFAATNNLLLSVPTLHRLGVTAFDSSLQFSGGSDVDFTSRLVGAGARLVWNAEPLVTEAVPADRVSAAWCLKRAVRTGENTARLRLGAGPLGVSGVARALLMGVGRIMASVPGVVAGLVARDPRLLGTSLRGCMRGLGIVRFGLGGQGSEYAAVHRADGGANHA